MSPLLPVLPRRRIAISCAHVGTHGARSPCGRVIEEPFSRLVAGWLMRELAGEHEVRLVAEPLERKAQKVNDLDPSLVVEVHVNAAVTRDVWDSDRDGDVDELVPAPGVGGHFALYQPGSTRGRTLARDICVGLSVELPDREPRGALPAEPPYIARKRLELLAETRCPAVIVECLHVTNPDEVTFLAHPDAPRVVARGVARGIRSWLLTDGDSP